MPSIGVIFIPRYAKVEPLVDNAATCTHCNRLVKRCKCLQTATLTASKYIQDMYNEGQVTVNVSVTYTYRGE